MAMKLTATEMEARAQKLVRDLCDENPMGDAAEVTTILGMALGLFSAASVLCKLESLGLSDVPTKPLANKICRQVFGLVHEAKEQAIADAKFEQAKEDWNAEEDPTPKRGRLIDRMMRGE